MTIAELTDSNSSGVRALSELPSLATVIQKIAADEGLPPARRRDVCSALRTMAKAAGRPPEQVPASPEALRRLTAGFHPEQGGFSRKRWQNARSEAAFAFRHVGLTGAGRRRREPLLPAWQGLRDVLAVHNKKLLHWGLSRFSCFCSERGIAPEEVGDATLALFRQAMAEESLSKDPDLLVYRAAWLWNLARRQVPGWPASELTVANRQERFALPLAAFPVSFQADVAVFLERMGGNDPFREDGPARPVATATLLHRRGQIRRLASVLVLSGIPAEAITSLADLVAPERFRRALTFLLQRHGGTASSNIHDHAVAMLAIARHHVRVDAATLAELRRMAARLKPKWTGLTEKNRGLLRQFDDPRNKALLLHLPRRLLAEAEARGAPDRQGALLVQMAVAVELLLLCMIRRKNLVSLDAERHFRWSRAGRTGVCHLAIEAAEVKNREPLEFELPEETAALLKLYLEHYQPLLRAVTSSWLFPGRTGRVPKDKTILAVQIARCVFSRTGIRITPHVFRHFGAKLHLDAQPGSYEVLRRVFGHVSQNTTYRSYCGLEMLAAARHVDAGILAQRDAGRPLLVRRNRRHPMIGRS